MEAHHQERRILKSREQVVLRARDLIQLHQISKYSVWVHPITALPYPTLLTLLRLEATLIRPYRYDLSDGEVRCYMFKYHRRFSIIEPNWWYEVEYSHHTTYSDYGYLIVKKHSRTPYPEGGGNVTITGEIPLLMLNNEFKCLDGRCSLSVVYTHVLKDINHAYQEYQAELILLGETL